VNRGGLWAAAAAALLAAAGLSVLPSTSGASVKADAARNGEIAFIRNGNLYNEGVLRAVDPDGSRLRRVIKSGWVRDASWSPDGKRLAIVDKCAIKVLPAAGGKLRTIVQPRTDTSFISGASDCYADVAWSPDGRRLVFMRCRNLFCPGGGGALYVVDANGRGRRQLTQREYVSGRQWSSPYLQDSGPDWSPDGRTILFSRLDTSLPDPLNGNWANHARLYRVNPDGTGLADLRPPFAWSPKWSPDGTRIVFSRTFFHKPPPGATRTQSIVVMNADGTGERTLLEVDSRENRCDGGGWWGWDWSPDGTKLAFSGPCPAAVYVMDVEGGARVQVTRGPDRVVSWRPRS
jgi:Tol biopolymer transport system component